MRGSIWLYSCGIYAVSLGTLKACVALRDGSNTPTMCGPAFTVNVSGDGSTSTLSTQSVGDTVNETRVLCVDGDVDKEICIVGKTFQIVIYVNLIQQTPSHIT